MKTTLSFAVWMMSLNVSFASGLGACPDLAGKFLCPAWRTQPEYLLYVSQSPFPGGVAYSHFFSFAEILDVTIANETGTGIGVTGTCRDKKMIIGQTENLIGANGNYQAFVNGQKVIECARVTAP